jgi:hypothetical protein
MKADEFDLARRTIRRLTDGTLGPYGWDDAMGYPLTDPGAEALRKITQQVFQLFPAPDPQREYASSEGIEFLKLIARRHGPGFDLVKTRRSIPPTSRRAQLKARRPLRRARIRI